MFKKKLLHRVVTQNHLAMFTPRTPRLLYALSSIRKSSSTSSRRTRSILNRFRDSFNITLAPRDSGVSSRLSLHNQDSIPEPLRLPRPADPLARLGAGLLDAGISIVGGSVAGYLAFLGSALPEVGLAAAQGTAIALFSFRDAFGDEGNRSIGKKVFSLELALWDGQLPSPSSCAARSWYLCLIPIASLHPVLLASLEVGLFFDLASLLLTQDARKAGDYMFGTRVVEERPGRDERVKEYIEQVEIEKVREEIEALQPGLLTRRGSEAAL
jgi:uncharacterized RDD family membrane protein YckC